MYFRNAVGAIVVYDTTNKDSYESVDGWIQLIRNNSPVETVICLVGNKIDRVDDLVVSVQQGKKKSNDLALASFWEVSAKENVGLDDMLGELASKIYIVQNTTMKKEESTLAESITKRTFEDRVTSVIEERKQNPKKCPCSIF